MKNLMIIGSTSYFLDLVNKAIAKKLNVIICDELKNSICKSKVEISYEVGVKNTEELIKIAKENKIDGVITSYTDSLMEAMVDICEKLELPCVINKKQLINIENKKRMKNILKENKVKIVNYKIVSEMELESLNSFKFPIIIKPLDSCGSKGITIINNYDYKKIIKAFNYAKLFSSKNEIIVEEFYKSEEVQVMSWINDGKVNILYSGDRKLNAKTLTPSLLIYPSKYEKEYLSDIKIELEKIVDAFRIENGPLYSQILIGDDGIKVCEFMTRFPAGNDYILLNEILGIDIESMYIDFCLGANIYIDKKDCVDFKQIGFIKPIYRNQCNINEFMHSKKDKLEFIKKINYYQESVDSKSSKEMLSDIVARVYCLADDYESFNLNLNKLEEHIEKYKN